LIFFTVFLLRRDGQVAVAETAVGRRGDGLLVVAVTAS